MKINWNKTAAIVGIAAGAVFLLQAAKGKSDGGESGGGGGLDIPFVPDFSSPSNPSTFSNPVTTPAPVASQALLDGWYQSVIEPSLIEKKVTTISGSKYAGGGTTNPENPRLSSGATLPIISGGTGSLGNPTAVQVLVNKISSPSVDVSRAAFTKKSGGSSTYSPSGGDRLGKSYKLAGSTTGMTASKNKNSFGFGGKW